MTLLPTFTKWNLMSIAVAVAFVGSIAGFATIASADSHVESATKVWTHTDVCFEQDNDGDGFFSEDDPEPMIDNDLDGVFDEDPIDGVDNDGDGAIDEDPSEQYDEDPIDCVDETSAGTVLDENGQGGYSADAVVAKNGRVKNYNPGQVYARTEIVAGASDVTIEFVEMWSDCTDLLISSPSKGGGRLIVVRDNDGTLEEILNAKDIEELDLDAVIDGDGASFDLDLEAETTYYVYAKFAPNKGWNINDLSLPQSCTNEVFIDSDPQVDPPVASAVFEVVEKIGDDA